MSTHPSGDAKPPDDGTVHANRPGKARGIFKMVAVAVAAFAFTFALIPLYNVACEKVFGIRLDGTVLNDDNVDALAAGNSDRLITVQFDGSVNSKLPWAFHPDTTSIRVRPGELFDATYFARNDGSRAIVGNAVPSVAPARASGYFSKTECFCFTAQTLDAGESRDMPVRFIVAPNLPEDIKIITLSYTFYKNEALTDQLAAKAPASVARAAP